MAKTIESRNLTKRFGKTRAVDNVSISVDGGELFGLLGPNGSGKTTMIKMLTGQIKPTKGSARILGIEVKKDPVRIREMVGIIPEQENPPSFLTSEEYLHFVSRIRKLDDYKARADEWFDFLDFADQRKALCKDLSRGTRQKLMFAQAFIHEPRLAFIDEPLINLDPIIQRKIKNYLKRYINGGGTIFFSTHVLEIAEEICTSIGVIDKGRILYQGKMKDLKRKRQHLETFFIRLVNEA